MEKNASQFFLICAWAARRSNGEDALLLGDDTVLLDDEDGGGELGGELSFLPPPLLLQAASVNPAAIAALTATIPNRRIQLPFRAARRTGRARQARAIVISVIHRTSWRCSVAGRSCRARPNSRC